MDDRLELPYWLALRRAGLGSTNFSLLVSGFGNISQAWEADSRALAAAGLDPQYIRAVHKARMAFDADRELSLLEKHGVRALTWLDPAYPSSLAEIHQSPPVLFVRGAAGPQFENAVAVVGTRRVTPYGRQACELFCEALALAGVAIISGLARGVDSIAHRVAIEHGTPTVAVLAGGVDTIYPRENQGLADRILETGCLISEYPIGIPARPDYFPRRNRILSGLARATLVVEAGEGSGALHTANWAFEQHRDVFAIPGSIFSKQSAGTNQLIRENTAKLVATPEQLCEELNLISVGKQVPLRLAENGATDTPSSPAGPPRTPGTEALFALLSSQALHVDELARTLSRPVAEVSGMLTMLELEGYAIQEGPMKYRKS